MPSHSKTLSLELNQNMLKLSSGSISVTEMHHSSKSMWSQNVTSLTNIQQLLLVPFDFNNISLGQTSLQLWCLGKRLENVRSSWPNSVLQSTAPEAFSLPSQTLGLSSVPEHLISELALSSVKQRNLSPLVTSSNPNIFTLFHVMHDFSSGFWASTITDESSGKVTM